MVASVSINVSSPANTEFQKLKFFEAEIWEDDTEKQLLGGIKEILNKIGLLSISLDVSITVVTSDVSKICFLLKKQVDNFYPLAVSKFSIREIEILGLIMQGLTNNEIGEKLFISYETVKSHRKHILEKTGAKNTVALINYYHQTFFEK